MRFRHQALWALAILLPLGTLNGSTPDPDRTALEQANRDRTVFFWEHVFAPHKVEQFKDYVAPQAIEHNPTLDGSLDTLVKYFKTEREQHPGASAEPILMTLVDGDLVAMIVVRGEDPASAGQPHPNKRLGMEIFRLKDGKQVEHWDETIRGDDPMLSRLVH